jgi:hypothetical protein
MCAGNRSDDQLRNAHASSDRYGFGPEVYEQYLYLTAVVGIDRAGRIEHRESMTRRQTRTRPDLRFVAF